MAWSGKASRPAVTDGRAGTGTPGPAPGVAPGTSPPAARGPRATNTPEGTRRITLTAKAHCAGCEWTAGPGAPAETDRAADKHVRPGHSTTVISWNPAREAA